MQPLTDDRGQFRFTVSLADLKCERAGDPQGDGRWTMRGHAAVFNRLSHDMGGFRVKIMPGFFTKVLDANPDVHLNREHDMRLLLARTKNNSLELREDPYGLHTWARFVKTPLADETATLMSEGVLDQMSFACDIGASQWVEDAQGNITWELIECDGLYDVTICAQGAFPQTDSQLVASVRDASATFAAARDAGLVTHVTESDEDTAGASDDTNLVATEDGGAGQRTSIAQPPEAEGADAVAASRGGRDLAALKEWAETRFAQYTHPE